MSDIGPALAAVLWEAGFLTDMKNSVARPLPFALFPFGFDARLKVRVVTNRLEGS